jgi:hypothetical protein
MRVRAMGKVRALVVLTSARYRPKWISTLRRLSCALRFVSPSSSYVPIRTCIVPVSAARDLRVSI